MAKKSYSFRLSDETKQLIEQMAKILKRSEGNLIEVVIEEKAKELKLIK